MGWRLMTFFLFFLFWVSELGAQSKVKYSEQAYELALLVNRAKASVVSIRTYFTESRRSWCRVGSGFVYDKDGYVITRKTVIEGADSIIVTFVDGKRGFARIVDYDEATEVALLELPFDNLPAIPMGKVSDLKTPSQLFLLGNSVGVFPSVTFGSYLGQGVDGMLQLGVVVPPGNCGGPVIDQNGRAVGMMIGHMLSAFESQSKGARGVALPMERVDEVMKKAVHKGSKKDGWIGISVVDLENGNHGRDSGVRVLEVVPGGPTAAANICRGDTIIQFEGKSIRDARELAKWVRTTPPDNYITFTLIKAAQQVNRQVLVERMPSKKEQR